MPIAKEVKEEILGKIKQGEKVVAVSKQYGVSEKTIYYWLWSSTTGQVSLMEHNKLKRENEELKAIIRAMTIEVAEYTEKRYQLYSRSMIGRIKEIRRLQNDEHLPLTEIRKRVVKVG